MKYLLFSLFSLLLAFGCCIHDDDVPPPLDGIQVRLQNSSSFDMTDASLRFTFGIETQEYQNYGSVAIGDSTGYFQYPAAGLCSVDFRTTANGDTINGLWFMSVCDCICPMDEGFYTLRLTDRMQGDSLVLDGVIEED